MARPVRAMVVTNEHRRLIALRRLLHHRRLQEAATDRPGDRPVRPDQHMGADRPGRGARLADQSDQRELLVGSQQAEDVIDDLAHGPPFVGRVSSNGRLSMPVEQGQASPRAAAATLMPSRPSATADEIAGTPSSARSRAAVSTLLPSPAGRAKMCTRRAAYRCRAAARSRSHRGDRARLRRGRQAEAAPRREGTLWRPGECRRAQACAVVCRTHRGPAGTGSHRRYGSAGGACRCASAS